MTAARDAAAFASAWVRSADGLALHARVYGEDGARDRLPVVGLPGLTRNASEFHRLAQELIAAGATDRVVAVDYRGRGLSDHDPDPSRYTVPVETTDLLLLLGHLGVERAVFVGVSRGGLIAMPLGAARPDLVRGIVLNDIGPAIERAGLLRIKSYVGRLGTPTGWPDAAERLRALFGGQFPALDTAEWRDWAETVWRESDGRLVLSHDPALARGLDALDLASPIPDLWPVFDALRAMPMMVVRGGRSDLLSAETMAEMARRHPGLDRIEVPDEGHTPLLHRPALAARIADFVRSLQPGR